MAHTGSYYFEGEYKLDTGTSTHECLLQTNLLKGFLQQQTHLQQECSYCWVQNMVSDACFVQSHSLLSRFAPGGPHGQETGNHSSFLPAAHSVVGVQHDTHQSGAAPREASDEDDGRVFGNLLAQGHALVAWAEVELHPSVAMAFWRAVDSAHSQVQQGCRAQEHAAQEQVCSGASHAWCAVVSQEHLKHSGTAEAGVLGTTL